MKSLFAFWMGWSLAFVVTSDEAVVQAAAGVCAFLVFNAWMRACDIERMHDAKRSK